MYLAVYQGAGVNFSAIIFFVIPIDISKILIFEMHIENMFQDSFF